jgi:hypothetical protein
MVLEIEGEALIRQLSDDMSRLKQTADGLSSRSSEMQSMLDVVWEKLFEIQEQMNGVREKMRLREAYASNVWPGDILHFGDFHGKRLRWKVLSVQKGNALIIADECLEHRQWCAKGQNGGWELSPMREWLNTVFLKHLDVDVLSVRLENKALNYDDKYEPLEDEPDTVDKVFLLSVDEVCEHFSADASRIALLRGVPVWWWLRTKGALKNTQSFVLDNGMPVSLGALASSSLCCPRPACWLSLEAIEELKSSANEHMAFS